MTKKQDHKPQFKSPAIDHKKPVSGDRNPVPEAMNVRLPIKLTIPGIEIVQGERSVNPRLPNNTPRVCDVCGKVCSSGKGLGGHRRSHVQAAKKEALMIKKAGIHKPPPVLSSGFRASNVADSFLVSGPITCSICLDGRIFTSIKALSGHMRSHPERDWRGIKPPKNVKHSPASTISDDRGSSAVTGGGHVVVDLTKSLRSWPVAAKRGRSHFVGEASGSACGSRSGLEEEQMQEAVNDLLMLARGGRPNDCASSSKKPGYDYVHGSKIPSRGIKIEERRDFSESARKRSEIAVPGMEDKVKGKSTAMVDSGFGAKDSILSKKGGFQVSQAGAYGYSYDNGRKFPSRGTKIEERCNTNGGAIRMNEIVRDRMEKGKGNCMVESRFGAKGSSLSNKGTLHVSQAGYGYSYDHRRKLPSGTIKIGERCNTNQGAIRTTEIVRDRMDKGKGKAMVESGFGANGSNLSKMRALHVSQAGDYGYRYDHGGEFPSRTVKIEENVRDRMDKGKGKAVVESGVDTKGSKKMKMEDYEDETDRKIKKRRLADLEKDGELLDLTQDKIRVIPHKYICITCDKSFATYQALGGHRAGHSKNKKLNNVKQSALASNVPVTDNGNLHAKPTINVKVERQVCEGAAKGSRVVAASGGEHQCNFCNMSFSTGQALGGHKLRHLINPPEVPSTSSQVTPSAGEVTQTARRVHYFDLNLPPPVEDGDQVIQ